MIHPELHDLSFTNLEEIDTLKLKSISGERDLKNEEPAKSYSLTIIYSVVKKLKYI